MTISIGRAESLGKGVFILLGKETRIRVPHHFSPAFFCQSLKPFLRNQGAIDGKEEREKSAPGKEKDRNNKRTKHVCEGAQTPPPALQNPKTSYESDPHGARNSKKEEIFWEEMILNHSNEKKKPIKEFVIVTSRDSFGWLKTMAARHKGKNPTNG